MKSATRFWGGVLLVCAVMHSAAFAKEAHEEKRAASVARETASENPCFPSGVAEGLDGKVTANGRRLAVRYAKRLAALKGDTPEFRGFLEDALKWSVAWNEPMNPALFMEVLTGPELGLNQAQVDSALKGFSDFTTAAVKAKGDRRPKQDGKAVLKGLGVPEALIKPLLGMRESGIKYLIKIARDRSVPLTRLRVWLANPLVQLELIPMKKKELAKEQKELDREIALQAAELLSRNFLEAVKSRVDASDLNEARAARAALAAWNGKGANDVKRFGRELRALQTADFSTKPVELDSLKKAAGPLASQLAAVLGAVDSPICFVNDHQTSRLAKLKALKGEKESSKKTVAESKPPAESSKPRETASTGTKKPEEAPKTDPKKVAEQTQSRISDWARKLVGFIGGTQTPTSLETKAPEETKVSEEASPAEAEVTRALTDDEITLLSEGIPTLVMYKNGAWNPKVQALLQAIEAVDPKLGDQASEDKAAAMIATLMGSLSPEQRKAAKAKAAGFLSSTEPRLKWLAQRLSWAADLTIGEAQPPGENAESFNRFSQAFNQKWAESKEAGQKFYKWIGEMEDPAKRLGAIQKLQTSYDKDAALKWASVHYNGPEGPAKEAAKKFLEALTSDKDGRPSNTIAHTAVVDGVEELREVTLESDPEKRWAQIGKLASDKSGFTYAPKATPAQTASSTPQTPPPTPKPPPQPPARTQPAQGPSAATQSRGLAAAGKCNQCHSPDGGQPPFLQGLDPAKLAERIRKMGPDQFQEMIGNAELSDVEAEALKSFAGRQ